MMYSQTLIYVLCFAVAMQLVLIVLLILVAHKIKSQQINEASLDKEKINLIENAFSSMMLSLKEKAVPYADRIDLLCRALASLNRKYEDSTNWLHLRNDIISKQILPEARKLINNPGWLSRYYLCMLLIYHSESSDEKLILSLLSDEVNVILINAIHLGSLFRSTVVIQAIIDRITKERNHTQKMLISDITISPEFLDVIKENLRSSRNPFCRKTCYLLLSMFDSSELFFDIASNEINDEYIDLRLNAIRTMVKCNPRRSIPYLLHLVNSESWQTRNVCIRCLGKHSDTAILKTIASKLSDPVWWVRQAAGEVLATHNEKGRKIIQENCMVDYEYFEYMAQDNKPTKT